MALARTLDQEVDDEIAFHIEMRTRELVEKGVDPRIAREMVLARLGDAARLKRTCVDLGRKANREMRLTQWLDEFRDDVRFALRQLKMPPTFTLVATITLALGIGANSAMFALADATLIRPLPYPEPDRLVMVWESRLCSQSRWRQRPFWTWKSRLSPSIRWGRSAGAESAPLKRPTAPSERRTTVRDCPFLRRARREAGRGPNLHRARTSRPVTCRRLL